MLLAESALVPTGLPLRLHLPPNDCNLLSHSLIPLCFIVARTNTPENWQRDRRLATVPGPGIASARLLQIHHDMPAYLIHGFRWPRPLIRIHIILQNIDDAAAEWLVAPGTTAALLQNFTYLFPDAMEHLPQLRFIEQYDPEDITASAASQPYAYVADVVHEVKLGIDIDEVRGRGLGNEQWTALMELRDKVAPNEKLAWYVVICGDEEREAPPTLGLLEKGMINGSFKRRDTDSTLTDKSSVSAASSTPHVCAWIDITLQQRKPTPPEAEPPKGLRKLFGSARLARRKSYVHHRSSLFLTADKYTSRQNMEELQQIYSNPNQPPSIPRSATETKAPPLPAQPLPGYLTNGRASAASSYATAELSASPPTNGDHVNRSYPERSVSPVIERGQRITPPGTRKDEVSVSPLRRGSLAQAGANGSRGVSPANVQRAAAVPNRALAGNSRANGASTPIQKQQLSAAQQERLAHQQAALAALSQAAPSEPPQAPEPEPKSQPRELKETKPEVQQEKRRSRRFSLQSLKEITGIKTANPPPLPTAPIPQDQINSAQPTKGRPAQPPKLNTKVPLVKGPQTAPAGPASRPTERDADDEFEDIIAMSPVTPIGLQKFRRSRSSLVLYSNGASGSHQNLNSTLAPLSEGKTPDVYQPSRQQQRSRERGRANSEAVPSSSQAQQHHQPPRTSEERREREERRRERRRSHAHAPGQTNGHGPHEGDDKRREMRGSKAYFGENVSQFDLIANNIENAFSSMR